MDLRDAPKRVLVVDDDAPIRLFEVMLLKDAGYTVSEARDGAAAIALLRADGPTAPDLVLLDLMMPGIDGWGVLEHIATIPHPPRVVVVSGAADTTPPEHLAAYVQSVVAKPFAGADLLKVCARALFA